MVWNIPANAAIVYGYALLLREEMRPLKNRPTILRLNDIFPYVTWVTVIDDPFLLSVLLDGCV